MRTTVFNALLSESTREKSERVIVYIAIVSFLIHLVFIALTELHFIHPSENLKLFKNPIAAIYTPFSFILLYEVYLLIYYIPKSFTVYIGKQYEIITLIVIRRLFKDLSNLELTKNWFETQDDLQFTYDLIATLILFVLIFIFYKLNEQRVQKNEHSGELKKDIKKFILRKKMLSLLLVPILLVLALSNFSFWLFEFFVPITDQVSSFKDINEIFFDEFFTVLILTDVLLLLFSFFHTNEFYRVMRNSGFIISTILIRISFGTTGLLNTALIITAVVFGVCILAIHNLYQKVQVPK
jgi:hypothetical protein